MVGTSPNTQTRVSSAFTPGEYYLYLDLGALSRITAIKTVLITVTKNSHLTPYLAYVDFLRVTYNNIFYLDKLTNVTVNDTPSADPLFLWKLSQDGMSDEGGSTPVNINDRTEGFYRIHYGGVNRGSFSATFYTDAYHCPYPQGYNDLYGIFSGCVHAPSTLDVLVNQHAVNALKGHSCKARQYYRDVEMWMRVVILLIRFRGGV